LLAVILLMLFGAVPWQEGDSRWSSPLFMADWVSPAPGCRPDMPCLRVEIRTDNADFVRYHSAGSEWIPDIGAWGKMYGPDVPSSSADGVPLQADPSIWGTSLIVSRLDGDGILHVQTGVMGRSDRVGANEATRLDYWSIDMTTADAFHRRVTFEQIELWGEATADLQNCTHATGSKSQLATSVPVLVGKASATPGHPISWQVHCLADREPSGMSHRCVDGPDRGLELVDGRSTHPARLAGHDSAGGVRSVSICVIGEDLSRDLFGVARVLEDVGPTGTTTSTWNPEGSTARGVLQNIALEIDVAGLSSAASWRDGHGVYVPVIHPDSGGLEIWNVAGSRPEKIGALERPPGAVPTILALGFDGRNGAAALSDGTRTWVMVAPSGASRDNPPEFDCPAENPDPARPVDPVLSMRAVEGGWLLWTRAGLVGCGATVAPSTEAGWKDVLRDAQNPDAFGVLNERGEWGHGSVRQDDGVWHASLSWLDAGVKLVPVGPGLADDPFAAVKCSKTACEVIAQAGLASSFRAPGTTYWIPTTRLGQRVIKDPQWQAEHDGWSAEPVHLDAGGLWLVTRRDGHLTIRQLAWDAQEAGASAGGRRLERTITQSAFCDNVDQTNQVRAQFDHLGVPWWRTGSGRAGSCPTLDHVGPIVPSIPDLDGWFWAWVLPLERPPLPLRTAVSRSLSWDDGRTLEWDSLSPVVAERQADWAQFFPPISPRVGRIEVWSATGSVVDLRVDTVSISLWFIGAVLSMPLLLVLGPPAASRLRARMGLVQLSSQRRFAVDGRPITSRDHIYGPARDHLDRILNAYRTGHAHADCLVGDPRTGKSSVMLTLQSCMRDELPNHLVFYLADTSVWLEQAWQQLGNLVAIEKSLCAEIHGRLAQTDARVLGSSTWHSFDDITKFCRAHPDVKMCLMFDEANLLLNDGRFDSLDGAIRSAYNLNKDSFGVVVALHHLGKAHGLGSGLRTVFRYFGFQHLSRADRLQLVYVGDPNFQFDVDVAETLVDVLDRSLPLHRGCDALAHRALQDMNFSDTLRFLVGSGRIRITRQHLEAIGDQINAFAGECAHLKEHALAVRDNVLGPGPHEEDEA
jgi:hypothetical protein